MVSLSKRLNAVASLVESGSSVADVGTDHGYIPVYLVENKISPFVDRGECDTVIIAGMGAELIVDILSNCDFVNELHLILQPMTHPEIARKYLYDNGFEINNDFIVTDAKHSYSIFDANYTGKITPKVPTDYFLGNITDFSQKEYFLHLLNYLKNKSKSGADLSDVISAVEEIL